jgi:transposase
MPSSHRRHAQWSPARFINWAADIGIATTQVVKHLLENRPHPEHGYRSCLGILTLTKQYGKSRVEAACARALAAGSMTSASVRSILKQGLDKIPMEEPEQQQELPLHENVRGAECFQ